MKLRRKAKLSPSEAARKLSGKPPAQPQAIRRLYADLEEVERVHLDILDAPGETFARLPQEIHRRRTQEQEAAGSVAAPTPLVDQSPQFLEDLRDTVDLIENDEAVFIGLEKERGVRELVSVFAGLQIEI